MSPSDQPIERSRDGNSSALYVGYRPMPVLYRRFLQMLMPPIFIGIIASSVLLASSYRSPGDGRWDTDSMVELEGTIMTNPYAMISIDKPGGKGGEEILLLVLEGKRGAADAVAGLDGHRARATGFILERDGHRLLELSAPLKDMGPVEGPMRGEPVIDTPTRVDLRGEIIDPKCYFGAMKPGEGKTHKECATLCIAGGIPPMFVVRGANGEKSFYVLADEGGGSANILVLSYVADPVMIRGVVNHRAGLKILRVDHDGIQRR